MSPSTTLWTRSTRRRSRSVARWPSDERLCWNNTSAFVRRGGFVEPLWRRETLCWNNTFSPMKLHALVQDVETARTAVAAGATVIQLRLKGAPTEQLVELGRQLAELEAELVVNDDVDAALALGCGVHLGQTDPGAERAVAAGITLGLSARTRREAAVAEFAGATYIGAGPVWATPSKPDAAEPIGLEGLAEVCLAVSVPVVAIGGVDAGSAAACIRAGAAGVAVIRAVADLTAVRAAVDAAL
jgi:thiamine-phosphate pyrophosphorylase